MWKLLIIAGSTVLLPATSEAVEPAARAIPPWVEVASTHQRDEKAATSPAPAPGPKLAAARPAVLLETSYPALDTADNPDIELYLSIDPNGYSEPVTVFLYRRDRQGGLRRYLTTGGLLEAGEVADLFGLRSPLAVWTPALSRLKLLGADRSALGPAPPQPAGRFMYVFELRDAVGARVIARSTAMYNLVSGTDILSGDITGDTTLAADRLHILRGTVVVRPGVTLTVEKGTVIFGETASRGALVVAQGARIRANGTAADPIVMTSPRPLGERQPGDWGGLVVNGYAPVNRPGGTAAGEGGTGVYGGGAHPDPTDDSGVITYLRVEFAGAPTGPSEAFNGIAFQGVGSGGTFHHLQAHFCRDDGVEVAGGTVRLKHVLITGAGDDALDWSEGWQGQAQLVVAVQHGQLADHLVEGDNSELDHGAVPRTHPLLYNFTLVGSGPTGEQGDDALMLRRGTAGVLSNFIVYGARETGLDLDDDETSAQIASGDLRLAHSVVAGNGNWTGKPNVEAGDASTLFANGPSNRDVEPMLASPFYRLVPDLTPLDGSAALDGWAESPPDDGFFEPVDFIGAIPANHNWTLDAWTTWSRS